jgi:hypothetical protein
VWQCFAKGGGVSLLDRLASLYEERTNGILADEMVSTRGGGGGIQQGQECSQSEQQ